MSFKTTYVLFAILLGFFVVLGVVLWLGPGGGVSTSPYLFPSLNPASGRSEWSKIDNIEIAPASGVKLTFVRSADEKSWTVNGQRANTGVVNSLIQSIATAKRDPHAEKPASLAAWGLTQPRATVTLKGKDLAQEDKLTIGTESLGEPTGVVYALSSERGQEPLAVPKSQLRDVLRPFNYFRDNSVLSDSGSDFVAVKVIDDKGKLGLTRKDGNRWIFTEGYTGDANFGSGADSDPAKPIDTVNTLTSALAALKVDNKNDDSSDFVADDVADFAQYNLDPAKTPVLRIEVIREESTTGADGKPTTKTVPLKLLVGTSEKVGEKKDKYYARLEGEKSVFRLSAQAVDRIRDAIRSPEKMRDRHLVRLLEGPAIDVIDIDRIGDKLEFRKVGAKFQKNWMLQKDGQTMKVMDAAVQGLINLLSSEFRPDEIDQRPADQEAVLFPKDGAQAIVTIWAAGLEEPKEEAKDKPEPKKTETPTLKADKKDKPTVKLTFGKTITGAKEQQVAVKREMEGEPVAFLVVPYRVLTSVKEGPLFYLDKELPKYNPKLPADTDVTTLLLELDGGNKVMEMSREKAGMPWKFTKPATLAGRLADTDSVTAILEGMNGLAAQALVNDKPTDKELQDGYGLKNPKNKVTITVTKDGKPVTFVYEFGKDFVTNATQVYAREVFPKDQGGRDMVFTVAKESLEPFGRELEDLSIFKYDPNDARGLKVSGWRHVLSLITLEFTSTDGLTWAPKSVPPGFVAEPVKAANLVRLLSNLRAERIVGRGASTIKPEYGFDPKTNEEMLEIEVTLKDGKAHKLTLGNASGDNAFYVRQGDDVFTISKSVFGDLKKSPKFFNP